MLRKLSYENHENHVLLMIDYVIHGRFVNLTVKFNLPIKFMCRKLIFESADQPNIIIEFTLWNMTLLRAFSINKFSKFCYNNLSTFRIQPRLYSTQQEVVVSFYDDKVIKYAEKSIRPVTLKELMRFVQPSLNNTSTLLESAKYTRSELPVRLARRVKALQNLPFIVGTNPYIKSIYKLYYNSFELIRSFPEDICDKEIDEKFAEMLKEMVTSHSENIPTLAKGMIFIFDFFLRAFLKFFTFSFFLKVFKNVKNICHQEI
jgi:hypothetical protein